MRKAEPDPILHNNVVIDVVVDDANWYTLPFDCKLHIKQVLHSVLGALSLCKPGHPLELSLLLANDARLRALNLDFRLIDKPTNVLSFPYTQIDNTKLIETIGTEDPIYLGDIAISYETIAQEANDQNKLFKDHFTHMIIHGILHLLGYDHIDDTESSLMESLEADILKRNFDIENPYIID